MSEAKMPQRYEMPISFNYRPDANGDLVLAEDVEPLVAEIERLRARVEVLEKHLGLMIANNLTGSFESEGLATDRAIAALPDWWQKATGRTREQWDAAAEIVERTLKEAKP